MSNVPIMAPSQVPEDLIVQVQNVLQGKSRSLIIRELQRTVTTFLKHLFHQVYDSTCRKMIKYCRESAKYVR